jgi:hypothetical protein
MGDCLKRSFEAGLRWCGINDVVPNISMSHEAEEFAKKYGLSYIDSGNPNSGNEPVLVIYKDDHTSTDSTYHSVFASDLAPFSKWEIFAVITGWRILRNATNNACTGRLSSVRVER